ncbi:type 1 fimbrial protein [Salmonella enterica]|nr:type 1 fimbrial protein [Salmonella enterica]EHM1373159.1 type 1 fimbrial protein [Salmonella enterica]
MNKECRIVAIAWFALLLIAGGLNAADVSMKGSLLDNTCLFEQEDAALEVVFPTRALKFFEQYGRTDTEKFVIGLKNCSAITQGKTVELSFTFPQSKIINGITMLEPGGGTGLVIGLVDGKGNTIVPEHPVEVGAITQTGNGNVNRYTLGAYVMAPPGASVTAGQYSATANFTVSYR